MTLIEKGPAPVASRPLLKVRDLSVDYPAPAAFLGLLPRRFRAVHDVSFDLYPGETLGIVGESGSGKSTTARAISRLTPVSEGTVRLGDGDMLRSKGAERHALRRRYQMVRQDPYSSLNPSMVVRDIIAEPLQVHLRLEREESDRRVMNAMELVGLLPDHMWRYPYEFSGGQRQRIAIARAIVLRPDLVILDEPVSALDVPMQNQIANLLKNIQREAGTAFLIIAHDLGLVRHMVDRTAVMYLGRLIEIGATEAVYDTPAHPYTTALLASEPYPDPARQRARRNLTIKGELPDLRNPPLGCVFSTRCPHVLPICGVKTPELRPRSTGQLAACHLPDSP